MVFFRFPLLASTWDNGMILQTLFMTEIYGICTNYANSVTLCIDGMVQEYKVSIQHFISGLLRCFFFQIGYL